MQGAMERAWAGNLGVWVLSVALLWVLVTVDRLLSLLWTYLASMGGVLYLKLEGLSLRNLMGPLHCG